MFSIPNIWNNSPDKDNLLIIGVGRSGTTWIESLFNHNNDFRTIFEPFHPKLNPKFKILDTKRYFRTENITEDFKNNLEQVLHGNPNSKHINQTNKKIIGGRKLIKSIRLNFILPYLKETYPELPLIYIIRNPLAVAYSQYDKDWSSTIEQYVNDTELMEDYLKPFEKVIKENMHKHLYIDHILDWCIENYVPLQHKEFFKLIIYEDLLNNENEIKEILNNYNIGINQEKLQKVINKPSKHSRGDKIGNTKTEWEENIPEKILENAIEIVKEFKLEEYL